MKLTIKQLRRIIREAGLETDMRHMAGTCGGQGTNSNVTDKEAILNPPPGLGSPEEQEEDIFGSDEQQQKNQPGARVYSRIR